MENKQITIDVGALHSAFQEALPAHAQHADAKVLEHDKVVNFAGLGLPAGVSAASLPAINICQAWAEFKSTCEMAFGILAWFPGMSGAITKGRSMIATLDRIIFAQICPAK